MDQIKKALLFSIPVSICNFRCHYCYLAQRDESFQGIHPEMRYSPEEFQKAISAKRIGGIAYANFCADGETLLVKNIDQYVKVFIEEGHYAEVVTNLSVTSVLDKFLSWDKEYLSHLEFKCSFHYLELKKRGMLETFANNVNRIWQAGASATIEITPSDELVPMIDEVINFSRKRFGALPHLTIARNDRTQSIDYLTKMDLDEYDRVWSRFQSDFWEFKKAIFGVKQKDFCYAGAWSLYINLCTGEARPCYCGESLGDVFANPDLAFPEKPIGKCSLPHCYNGHALMTLGLIPGATNVRYGNIRNRIREDDTQWLQPELLAFFNSQLCNNNSCYSNTKKQCHYIVDSTKRIYSGIIGKGSVRQVPFRLARSILGHDRYEKLKKYLKRN